MGKYYRIRATSFETYYSYVNSADYPKLFDDEGNPIEHELGEFELCNQTWDYGTVADEKDFVFSDYVEISEEVYNGRR